MRSDIEGLRGLAVLAVVVQHAFPGVLPGGFLGVDVFFVISGYVIGHSLIQAAQEHRLSIAGFYKRRIRRIFPPLVVVCAAVLAMGWLVLTPREFARLGVHVGAAAIFGNNILLWHEVGYFDASAAVKPLLHLWSLGVEEQFYLLLPILLWPLRHAIGRFARWMAIAAFVSFAAWLAAAATAPAAAFYLLPARWWELGAGMLLACAHCGAWNHQVIARALSDERVARAAAMVGIAGLVLSFVGIDESRWPGSLAVIPVVSTVLLIHLGKSRRLAFLSNAPLTSLGGISYPLYLWHWPALVYWRLLHPGAPPHSTVVPVLASVALAVATRQVVETPIRFGRWRHRQWVPQALVCGLALLGLAGWAGYVERGWPSRFGAEVLAADAGAEAREAWREGRCFFYMPAPGGFAPECQPVVHDASHSLAIWGDSHAAHLYPGLAQSLARYGYSIAQFTAASCPPTVEPLRRDTPGCGTLRAQALDAIAKHPPHTLVLAGAWRTHADTGSTADEITQAIARSVEQLRRAGVEEIVVVGPGPSWRAGLPAALFRNGNGNGDDPDKIPTRFGGVDETLRELDAAMSAGLSKAEVTYFSLVQHLCDAKGCVVRDAAGPAGELFYFDEAHLTVAGSRFVGSMLAEQILRVDASP